MRCLLGLTNDVFQGVVRVILLERGGNVSRLALGLTNDVFQGVVHVIFMGTRRLCLALLDGDQHYSRNYTCIIALSELDTYRTYFSLLLFFIL